VSLPIDKESELPLRQVPTDVYVVVGLVFVIRAVVASPVDGVVQSSLIVTFVLFLPGYAFTTAVFPGDESWGIDLVERVALSFGVSLVGVPMLLLAADPTGGLTAGLVVDVVTVTVLVFTCIGAVRRYALPATERFEVDFRIPVHISEGVPGERATVDGVLSVALVASMVLALGGFGYAIAAPHDRTATTGVSLLTQNGSEYTQAQYPTRPAVGEEVDLTLSIQNNEGRSIEYGVLVTLDTTTADGTVVSRIRVGEFQREVAAGEEWRRSHTVTPSVVGRHRLTYLVYIDRIPDAPSRDSAYRSVHLWIDVGESGSSDG